MPRSWPPVRPTVRNFWRSHGAIAEVEKESLGEWTQDKEEEEESVASEAEVWKIDKSWMKFHRSRLAKARVKKRLVDLARNRLLTPLEDKAGTSLAFSAAGRDDSLQLQAEDILQVWLDCLLVALEEEVLEESPIVEVLRTNDLQDVSKDKLKGPAKERLLKFYRRLDQVLKILENKSYRKYYQNLLAESQQRQQLFQQQNEVLHDYVCELEKEFADISDAIYNYRSKKELMLTKLAGLLDRGECTHISDRPEEEGQPNDRVEASDQPSPMTATVAVCRSQRAGEAPRCPANVASGPVKRRRKQTKQTNNAAENHTLHSCLAYLLQNKVSAAAGLRYQDMVYRLHSKIPPEKDAEQTGPLFTTRSDCKETGRHLDVSPEEALEAAWRAGEVQTMQAETESVEPQPDNMSDLDETELAESLQMLGRNGAPDIVQGQEVASPSSVKRKQDSDENGQESGSDLAEEDLRKAMTRLLPSKAQQEETDAQREPAVAEPPPAASAARDLSDAEALKAQSTVLDPEIEILKIKVQEAMKKTAQAQMRLRRKKAEEMLIGALVKHCEAACRVYSQALDRSTAS
ncbi:TBB [Symbiodinium pilosum]|uniref:TBB protein n=1 Tax=Symbiodinium pilosum TaxID=2952 RepID=A0A812VHK6_SYMPI|nr:TBB [Symbiodinium pilosum]